ncbi:PAS domain-containing SpoIIE family protein phosphatase/ATP-binding protein [Streptomyces sp. SKN60]|uniref:SpoIIE family protein phosphatase n=1 Tax=Streptomyces sp. SKN60 TaxID=2855506 RepID=UPI00224533D9|nr:SpoIIE family protein phosphatase [Streptomyces sp. SKN60]MCX2184593.1 PAS domain-containing SpoIIE family protein phosphatase/ATP-binding protein [Streptomyces sp. SKN60]
MAQTGGADGTTEPDDGPGGTRGLRFPAVVCVDARGRVTAWARGAELLLGHRSDEIVGRPRAELFDGPVPDPPSRALTEGRQWSGRVALRHRDGRRVDADVYAEPVRDATGDTAWVLLIGEPGVPGEQRRPPGQGAADDAEATALMSLALDQLPLALGVFDQNNHMVGANEEAYRAMAVTAESALGHRLGEVGSAPPYHRLEQLAAQVLSTGEAVRVRISGSAPEAGRRRVYSNFVYPLRDGDGRVRGTSIAALDITDQDLARRRLSLMSAAGEGVGTTLDVIRTAQELADVATERFADYVGVDLLDSVLRGLPPEPVGSRAASTYHRIAQRSVLDGFPESAIRTGQPDFIAPDSPMELALRTGRALRHRITDPDMRRWLDQEPARAERARTYGIHSYLVAPLLARGTTLGLVIFLRHRTPEPFDMEDLHLAGELAARAALAIDNARQYTLQRNTALTLQHSLLPRHTPRQGAVDVAFRYLPGSADGGVSGDWYDVIPLPGARVALVVGDVVGHGVHASAAMGRLRTAVRTLADLDLPPDELLTHLDDLVVRGDQAPAEAPGQEPTDGPAAGEVGATCLYAVYDPISRTCTMARAGHVGPAVLRPDGSLDFPELPAGPPLGQGDDLPFESTELDLSQGSVLALYTKGLVQGADLDAGLVPLRRALAEPAESLEDICDAVLDASFTGPPCDDIALLVARTRALDDSQVAAWDIDPDPVEVARARKLATEQLGLWGLEETAFVTELMVSELVTNAIRYGRPPISLRLIHDGGLVCEVSDGSSTAPHMRRARTYDEGGRGLLLVAQLSERWGTRHAANGKTIWAEQRLPADL